MYGFQSNATDRVNSSVPTLVAVVARVSLILGDLLVIGVTWAKTHKTGLPEMKHVSFSHILLRDGELF